MEHCRATEHALVAALAAERELLSGVLTAPAQLDRLPWLQAEDFSDAGSAVVFSTIAHLHRCGVPVDLVTVAAVLGATPAAAEAGGPRRAAAAKGRRVSGGAPRPPRPAHRVPGAVGFLATHIVSAAVVAAVRPARPFSGWPALRGLTSATIRTARSRNSSGYLLGPPTIQILQGKEFPDTPGGVRPPGTGIRGLPREGSRSGGPGPRGQRRTPASPGRAAAGDQDPRRLRLHRPTLKTHLSIALAVQAARRGHRVAFATAHQWIQRLCSAQRVGRLDAELDKLRRTPLLICDEVGYVPFEPEAAALFYALIASRYERVSLVLSSNKHFSSWTEIFGVAVAVSAMVDRLVHHAEIINLKGDSYRLKHRKKATANDWTAQFSAVDTCSTFARR